jgi:hypothetical protein
MRKEIQSAMTKKEGKRDATRRTTPRDHESQRETEPEAFTMSLRQARNALAVEAAKEETDRGGKEFPKCSGHC